MGADPVSLRGMELTAQSANSAVAAARIAYAPESGATLSVDGKTDGSTAITLRAAADGLAAETQVPVRVKLAVLTKLDVRPEQTLLGLNSKDVKVLVRGLDQENMEMDISGAQISYASEHPEIIDVTDNGVLVPKAVGGAVIHVTVTLGGTTLAAQFNIGVKSGKTQASYYTPEKVAAARENAEIYPWARETRQGAIALAEQYLDQENFLWSAVTTQELPRGATVGYRFDPKAYYCRYCGKNLQIEYGNYPWNINAQTAMWKVQCPDCRRSFPSNDFGSFYELGIGDDGMWSYELAKQKNQELVDAGQDGYLKNILHPEADEKFGVENWGVDDGYGYRTGRTYNTNTTFGTFEETHTYIAYFNHWGIWHWGSGKDTDGLMIRALSRLSSAYLYTGDKRYGRIGAILVDRVADVYPDMYIRPYYPQYFNSDSTSPRGKIIGCIWERGLIESAVYCYDAVYDMYDDPYVVNFLSQKAGKFDTGNDKSTPELIRQNVEDNLLREVRRAIEDANISGNFGMHQSTMAITARVLDTLPETQEMIDWIFQSGGVVANGDGTYKQTGGNVQAQLINLVNRDGMGGEGAPGYNASWMSNLSGVATILDGYETYAAADLYRNPKYIKMFSAFFPLTLCRRTTASIGDSGSTAGTTFAISASALIPPYLNTRDPELGQMIYFLNGNTTDGLHADIFTEDPNGLQEEIRQVISEYGEYDFDRSQLEAGTGFAVLRGGSYYKTALGAVDTQRDFWMYSGGGYGHCHPDTLNLGVHAYGLDLAPDFGYPEGADGAYKNVYWGQATLNHNTVMVNAARQKSIGRGNNGDIKHFDDAGRVKLIDMDAPQVYDATDIYRRTVVMVEASDEVSYGVDFFRIKGGNDHLYSFHALSDTIHETQGLELTAQNGGTYAGPDVELGKDTKILNGFNFLYDVRRAGKQDGQDLQEFAVDFKITDFRKTVSPDRDLHLRLTMLNDFSLSEVALASGQPPQKEGNPKSLEFVLARRQGSNLDTLFTTVLEPYDGARYIQSMEQVPIVRVGGAQPQAADVAKAVKVTLENGRVDYVVYATNNQVLYRIDDQFDFAGFVGVHTLVEGQAAYSYMNDGTRVGDLTGQAAYTGVVESFTQELALENSITVALDQSADPQELVGRFVYIDNKNINQNAVYPIEKVTSLGGNLYELHVGNRTLIRSCINDADMDAGYNYNIAEGQSLRIPLCTYNDSSPVIQPVGSRRVSVGSRLAVQIQAESPLSRALTLEATDKPRGAQFDPATNVFSWTPDSGQIGKHHVSIRATDGIFDTVLHFEVEVFQASSGGGGGATPNPGPGTEPGPGPGDDDGDGEKEPVNPPAEEERFVDLAGYDWAKSAIESLAEEGIIKGDGPNTFGPGKPISRADFTILLVRAFNISGGEAEQFGDVPADAYYAQELLAARAAGIAEGVGGNRFNPQGRVSRQDMMVLLYRTLQKSGYSLEEAEEGRLASFADSAQVAEYAQEAAAALIQNGIIAGDKGRIKPQGNASRAEVAVMLSRVLEKKQ